MSARGLLFTFGFIVIATGSLYVSQNPKLLGKAPEAGTESGAKNDELARVRSMALNLAKSLSVVQAATSKRAPGAPEIQVTEEAREADIALKAVLAKEDPSLAKRDVPMTAQETMKAALALQRRANGGALTGNESQDKILREIDQQEKIDAEDAARAPASNPARQESTIIVMDGTTGVDPTAEEKIEQLAVPESVRQEILNNYRRTGIMPVFNK